ncbi:sialidase family protein [Longimicrobium sp.]|uniref:sialidase family protein n=1 Tax=Longimicrobium sp. TaxID=2029185 RepID=UPI002C2E67DA|nr:sialidase family protein [Longimicrobium sp.]HSU13433.1 sialidase family protein [Longimicrobium sp.]
MKKNRAMMGGVAALAAAVAAAAATTMARSGSALAPAATLAAANASNPTAAADARGARYVAWIATSGGASDVWLARADGDAFAAPVRVNDRLGDAAPHEQAPAQVAVAPDGGVYVVWQNNRAIPGRRFPASDLRFARSSDGGRTFAPAVTVNDDAAGPPSSHTFHNIVVGKDGTVWVAWLDSRVRDAERARRHPHPAPAAAKPQGDSTMGMHGHGGMAEDPTLPGSEIRVAKSTDGGKTFGPSMVVDGNVCPCCRTSLATAPDGSVYVAWRKVYAGDVRDVVVARLAPGASAFAAPVRVHADGWVFPGCPHAGPSVAVDARGRLHVAWYTGKEGRQGLWYASSADGGRTFGAAAALLTGAWVPPSQVALAADGDHLWAMWDDRREQEGRVTLARLDDGTPHVVAREPAGRSPALAAGPRGLLVAWHQGQSVRASSLR